MKLKENLKGNESVSDINSTAKSIAGKWWELQESLSSEANITEQAGIHLRQALNRSSRHTRSDLGLAITRELKERPASSGLNASDTRKSTDFVSLTTSLPELPKPQSRARLAFDRRTRKQHIAYNSLLKKRRYSRYYHGVGPKESHLGSRYTLRARDVPNSNSSNTRGQRGLYDDKKAVSTHSSSHFPRGPGSGRLPMMSQKEASRTFRRRQGHSKSSTSAPPPIVSSNGTHETAKAEDGATIGFSHDSKSDVRD